MNFTPGIKYEIARLTGKFSPEILLECSKLLNDIISNVDIGKSSIGRKEPVFNRAKYTKEI